MKIAIGLFGEYSDWYKSNNYQGDLFSYSFDSHNDHNFKEKQIINGLERLTKEHQSYFNSIVHTYCISQCKQMIRNYEINNGFKYDIYIYAYFNDILWNFPTTQGEFVTHCASYAKHTLTNYLNSTQIISNYFIRQNGEKLINIYELNPLERHKLLEKLFNGKVSDIQFFKPKYKTNIFLIPSVIYTSDKPFDYTQNRSVFSPKERLKQTHKQVQSLQNAQDSLSIVLEGSRIGLLDMKLIHNYSYIVLFANDQLGNFYANVHWNKSSYEIYVLQQLYPLVNAEWIFKFGGRYHLSKNFNIKSFQKNKPVFKIIDKEYTYAHKDIIECVLYSIPNSFKETYIQIFNNLLQITNSKKEAIENLLLEHSKDFYQIEHLNVIGKDAIESFNRII